MTKQAKDVWLKLVCLPIAFCATHAFATEARLLPRQALYPNYLADPLRPTFNAQLQYYGNSEIADTGNNRFDLKLGARLPLYQSSFHQHPWQWVLLGGFHGQFDNTNTQDNIGWDGIYGLSLVAQQTPQLAWRFGIKHISAHIGDELIQRTGRQRIGYTREEWRLGVAWSPEATSTFYTEAGYAYGLRNSVLQKPWRLQLGGQYRHPARFWQQRFQWYSALDLSSYQENHWQLNTDLQLGISTHSGDHQWRLGLEFYNGRSQLGEFFQDRERYIGAGLWFDI
ncbi:MAG: DUF1207 domain-containing protein [Gammaproteobacteria bacterium]|jgi:hypothetical protein